MPELPEGAIFQTYQAPVQEWAWWGMLFTNVPFLQPNTAELMLTLKNNIKVALFFNVLWLLAALSIRRAAEPFVTIEGSK